MQPEEIHIKFPEGNPLDLPKATTAREALIKRGQGSLKKIVAARLNGESIDLTRALSQDGTLEPIFENDPEGLEILRHSTAHLMAQAVKELFPEVKLAIGPAIEQGFYYDFAKKDPFTPEDLPRIEEKMRALSQGNIPIVREEFSREEAIRLFSSQGESFKVEMLEELTEPTVSLYRQGNFVDMCRGPHLTSTNGSRFYKLTHVAGAYWRGDEHNPMLQRIYGTAFFEKKELDDHLFRLEEARRRDHRRIGRELDLFSIHDEVGPGLVIYHPKGAMLRTLLEDFEKKEHLRRGYEIVIGPQLLRADLWKKSGHYENYRELMYFTEIDGQGYGIKPMNCLAHMMIYKSKVRSYRDLPKRYFELGTVHRHEKSGVLHGLMRVRQFTQDDAHIICTPDQLQDEIRGVLNFVAEVMKIFQFDFEVEISTRPEKSIGSDQDWARAIEALIFALKANGLSYSICEGEGAFYGPKIDIKLKDALDRRWQCATIQCDFTLPERFDLQYVGADGERHRPVMVHRVILGAMERFIGVLIEHYAGAFPTWLAPVQAVILSVTDRNASYCQKVFQDLLATGIRVELDIRNEKLGLKVREAQLQKIPYMVVIGDKEEEQGSISPRTRSGENLGSWSVPQFIDRIREESVPGKQ
ncbi:MAG: threonine--tRNA ligase [Deltaproteobacteria bacterium RBG_13_43_22]|nr:MAG: threonine--tRNA ligase [Deltaproteobacteria bacterium RBG_13_43_22]